MPGLTAIASLGLAALCLQGAAVRQVRLTRPAQTFGHEFTQLKAVRELRDGRLLLTDRLEPALYVADPVSGALTRIGKEGDGPTEYRLPASLVPLPGDSTLLLDEGSLRWLVVGPDARIHRSVADRAGVAYSVWPRGADPQGRLYYQIPAWVAGPNPPPGDTVWVARLDLRTGRIDSLARVKGPTDPGPVKYGLPNVPFSPQDVWQVTPAGRLAFVRSADYHVEWREPDGRVRAGPRVPSTALPVTRQDRLDYTRQFLESSSMGGRVSGGGTPTGHSAVPASMLTPEAVAQMAERNKFATRKPPFTDFTPRVAPGGTLWVERSVAAGNPREFDVFDAAGVRTLQVTLPPGRRLLAVGERGIYLATATEDGFERLERYALP